MKEVALGEVCKVGAGQAAPKKGEFSEEGTPFVRAGSLEPLLNDVGEETLEKITPETARSKRLKLYPKDTVLFAKSGMSATLGRVYRLKGEAHVVSHLATLEPTGRYDPNYLTHWMRANPPSKLINDPAYPSIRLGDVENVLVPNLPLEEQRRIAAILDKAGAIRRKRQEALRLADEFLRSTFLEMFGDPVVNPKRWPVSKLGTSIQLFGGHAFKSEDYVQSGIPLVRIGTANKKNFDLSDLAFLPEAYAQKFQKFILRPNDIVITLTGTVGKDDYGNVSVVSEAYPIWLLNQRVGKISLDERSVTQEYLIALLRDPFVRSRLIKNQRGVRQANLKSADLLDLELPLPSIEQQKKFSSISFRALHSVSTMSAQLDQVSSLFASLSQRAFQGEL